MTPPPVCCFVGSGHCWRSQLANKRPGGAGDLHQFSSFVISLLKSWFPETEDNDVLLEAETLLMEEGGAF